MTFPNISKSTFNSFFQGVEFFAFSAGKGRLMKKNRTSSLAEMIGAVLTHEDLPMEIYNRLSGAFIEMMGDPKDTPEWVQFALDWLRKKDRLGCIFVYIYLSYHEIETCFSFEALIESVQ
jgi:hypothetical protein